MYPPSELPVSGEILLITDELLAPADFLLHRHVAAHLKASKPSKCVLVSVSEDIDRWKAVAQRSNLNLAQYLDSGSLYFIDAMPLASTALNGDASSSLKEIFHKISIALTQLSTEIETDVLVVLDDIASLEWVGYSTAGIVRFARALRATCRKFNASLVLRHHITTPGEPDDIFKHLLQLCTYHLDVCPLTTGRSGTVSGQVALHCGPATPAPAHRLIPRSAALHYRLSDTGSTFFDRGTGGGVL